VFELDEGGLARARSETLPVSELVLEVAESCPIEAIGITDTESGERIFPPNAWPSRPHGPTSPTEPNHCASPGSFVSFPLGRH